VATTFDGNNRRDVIDKDGSQIADYDYVGRRVDQPGATQHRAACCVKGRPSTQQPSACCVAPG